MEKKGQGDNEIRVKGEEGGMERKEAEGVEKRQVNIRKEERKRRKW